VKCKIKTRKHTISFAGTWCMMYNNIIWYIHDNITTTTTTKYYNNGRQRLVRAHVSGGLLILFFVLVPSPQYPNLTYRTYLYCHWCGPRRDLGGDYSLRGPEKNERPVFFAGACVCTYIHAHRKGKSRCDNIYVAAVVRFPVQSTYPCYNIILCLQYFIIICIGNHNNMILYGWEIMGRRWYARAHTKPTEA